MESLCFKLFTTVNYNLKLKILQAISRRYIQSAKTYFHARKKYSKKNANSKEIQKKPREIYAKLYYIRFRATYLL